MTVCTGKEMIKNSRILVTGGAGFIGSNLCEKLSEFNEVVSIDNYLTGNRANHVENVDYIECSSENITSLKNIGSFDYIFHFGEYSRVEQSFNEFSLVYENNIKGLLPILKLASKCNAKLIYSASSTKFYKRRSEDELSLSPYSLTKEINISLIKNYANWYGLNHAIVYFYNAYGKNEIGSGKYSTVIAKFLELKRKGAAHLPVTSPGTQIRNFTDVRDICNALQIIAIKGCGDGFGIGSERGYSILELVNLFRCAPNMMPEALGNRLDAELHLSKVKNLGWVPQYNLEDYITKELEKINRS